MKKNKKIKLSGAAQPTMQINDLRIVGPAGQSINMDGYGNISLRSSTSIKIADGYTYDHQINVRLTDEDMEQVQDINIQFFEGELSNSMVGRILLRRGIKWYKSLME